MVDTATTFEYGARVGYNLTEGIAFEGAWTYAKPNLDATALTLAGASGKIGELKSNTYEVDGLFSVGNDWASFYMVLGIGATTLQPVIVGVETRTSTDFRAARESAGNSGSGITSVCGWKDVGAGWPRDTRPARGRGAMPSGSVMCTPPTSTGTRT